MLAVIVWAAGYEASVAALILLCSASHLVNDLLDQVEDVYEEKLPNLDAFLRDLLEAHMDIAQLEEEMRRLDRLLALSPGDSPECSEPVAAGYHPLEKAAAA